MATRKLKYTIAPSSALTEYRTTIALVNEADRTERKRRKNESDRPRAGAHAANV
jgi:hypothetical protein